MNQVGFEEVVSDTLCISVPHVGAATPREGGFEAHGYICRVSGDRSGSGVEGQTFHDVLFSEPFWSDLQTLITVLRPMYSVLRLVDREGCTMGLIYEFMDRIGETIARSTWRPRGIAPVPFSVFVTYFRFIVIQCCSISSL